MTEITASISLDKSSTKHILFVSFNANLLTVQEAGGPQKRATTNYNISMQLSIDVSRQILRSILPSPNTQLITTLDISFPKKVLFYTPYTQLSSALDHSHPMLTPLPVWEGGSIFSSTNFPTVDRGGVISGLVRALGVIQPHSRVYLYYRKTGALIKTAITDDAGHFVFDCGLNRTTSEYFVVAVTDLPYNAQVFDKLTPQ